MALKQNVFTKNGQNTSFFRLYLGKVVSRIWADDRI